MLLSNVFFFLRNKYILYFYSITKTFLTFYRRFPTADDCLSAAKYMVATQISREPAVRKCIRQTYFERAKINLRPTKKGLKVSVIF